MDLKDDTMIKDSGLPLELASDKSVEQKQMECDADTDKHTDALVHKTSDVGKKQGQNLRRKIQISHNMIRQTSPSKVIRSRGASIGSYQDLRRKTQNSDTMIRQSSPSKVVRSRYRGTSVGSCHDMCKFGHNVDLHKGTKKPLLGTIREARPLISAANGDTLVKKTQKKDHVPVSEKDPTCLTEVTNSSEKVTPSPPQAKMKCIQSEAKPSASPTPGNSVSRSKIDAPAVKKTLQVKTSKKDEKVTVKESLKSNSPRTLLKKSPSIKAKLFKNLKSFSRSRRQSSSEDTKFNKSHVVPVDKAVSITEPNGNNGGEGIPTSLSSEESASFQSEHNISKPIKSDGKKKGSRFSLPSFSLPSSSKSDASEARQTSQPREENQQIDTVTRESKRRGASKPEENNASVWKVKFRRGTVVNLQVSSNSPKKLWFKRGRILGQGQTDQNEANISLPNREDMTNESRDVKSGPEKVRLRWLEASGKKGSIDMNNMIEETASKLVKTKKSKVKALVGAFESVMSFLDRKPSGEASAS